MAIALRLKLLKMKLNNIGGTIGIIGGIIGLAVGGYALLNVFTAGEKVRVHLGVKEQSKTYLLATRSTSAFKRFNSENPMVVKATSVVEIDDEIYVDPNDLDKIINLISKNHTFFNREKKKYDGFVTINGRNNNFSKNKIDEDGEKIGEYIRKNSIELKNDKGNIHHIRWIDRPDDIAEENCIVAPIVISDNYKPGATSYYTVDIIVVKLATILDFYDNGTTYEYDADNEILYFIQ